MSRRRPIRRALLKLSGEILRGDRPSGIDPVVYQRIATEVADAHRDGRELAIVVGGGNIFRGATGEATGIDRVTGDQIGMLATVANGLALRDFLVEAKVPVGLMSAIEVSAMVPLFDRRQAMADLADGRVLIFVAGTGHPYFTTDTAGALRAAQIGAEALLKGTKVDGVYDADPVTHPKATRFSEITIHEVLERRLGVLDHAAAALCADRALPLVVFDLQEHGNLTRVLQGADVGTWVAPESAEAPDIRTARA